MCHSSFQQNQDSGRCVLQMFPLSREIKTARKISKLLELKENKGEKKVEYYGTIDQSDKTFINKKLVPLRWVGKQSSSAGS